MDSIDIIAIEIARILEIPVDKTQHLINIISLEELSSITNSIASKDYKPILQLYNKYQPRLISLPSSEEVNSKMKEYIDAGFTDDAAKIESADFFGLPVEKLEALITNESVITCKKKINELNIMQRYELNGQVPKNVANIIQKTLDLTPTEIAQKYAKINGLLVVESDVTIEAMRDSLLEFYIMKLKEKREMVTVPMCTLEMKRKKSINDIVNKKF